MEILKNEYQKRIENASGLYFLNSIKLNIAKNNHNNALHSKIATPKHLAKLFNQVKICLYGKIKAKKAFTHVMQ